MLRDVFYYGKKPNIHPREQFAENLADARLKATTRDFWIINEFCDYRNFDWDFDFEFLPDEDVWAEDHNNAWPSQHQKDSGTWLCPKEHSDLIIYRGDVDPVIRKNEKTDHWVELDLINHSKFDFSWHPDPTDPPYIYKWPCKFFPAEFKHVLEYRVPGAIQEKYMNTIAELVPEYDRWVEHQAIDKDRFDLSWRPNPLDPPFIYIWGNKHVEGIFKPTLEYHTPGATDKKYMSELASVLPEWDRWVEVQSVDKTKFDFSWRPDPREPAYIYTWGNKHIEAELKPTVEYHCEGATERKYMHNDVAVLPEWNNYKILENIQKDSFDFSWRPDPREPALIYVFGNEFFDAVKMPTVEYHCEGATERKYMDNIVAKLAPNTKLFEHLEDSSLADYSWLPDPDSPPYIYAWGNQWNAPEDKISVQFVVQGATEYKYMADRATRKPCMDNWVVPDDVDTTDFDFSWEPNPAAPPYIYEFATQWQKTGGPQYIVSGATEKQYVDFQKVTKAPSLDKWTIPDNIDTTNFDFSWHPDDTSPPYNYVFATQWAFSGGPVYSVPEATETKYVDDQLATAKKDMTNWVYDASLIDVDSFDFSWHPYVEDQPYIYEFGTQHQKTGGPKYITPGADSSSPTKYIDTRILKATRLVNEQEQCWTNYYPIKNFDYSWHPDSTEEPFIYVFGNNLYPAEEMPTVEYHLPNATQIKFVNTIIATLDEDLVNWDIPKDVNTDGFDFSWKPNPTDPPYIYEFGTQHQKTGGPRYTVPGATEVKYLDFQTVTRNSVIDEHWDVLENTDKSSFDFSWHPDATDPPYIYAWGNQWVSAEDRPCIEYRVPGASEYRYMDNSVTRLSTQVNWQLSDDVDTTDFDFSWEPSPAEEPYIYQFGTQWQKTGGPRYVAEGATEIKYVDLFTTKKLPSPSKFIIVDGYVIKDFDYSWHPDETEEPFIYVFGNNLYPAEECATIEYHVLGATERKYVGDIVATLGVNTNWEIPPHIDTTGFDFTWVPNPTAPPYIYEFGTQHQKTGGPRYAVESATEVKYLDFQKVVSLPNRGKWKVPKNINVTNFDFSWHPDNTDPAYIYQFGTQWALSGGPSYCVPEATEIKYVDEQTAIALPNRDNWVYDSDLIDIDSFDFSWHPYVEDQAYIYEFGTQWQKTGGPKYITPGADSSSPIKYIDPRILKSTRLSNHADKCWVANYAIKDFDYSWHPDNTEEPYIYVFGNNLYPAEDCDTIQYRMAGATQVKYVSDIIATLDIDKTNWVITQPIDEEAFDFSWIPNPKDPPYIYRWGNKYISNKYKATIEYVVPGATDIKYMTDDVEVLPEWDRWEIPAGVDTEGFDFTWRPDPLEPNLIWEFGTQWQKTGGPRYVAEGATEIKYIDSQKVTILPNKSDWFIPDNVDVTEFDFSWHPDDTDPLYIYQFGTQWALSGGPRYVVSGATEVKYMDNLVAKALPDRTNWVYDEKLIDIADFDFSWHPYIEDKPYVYQFGTQWQKTGGPKYITPGADLSSPVKYIDTRIIKARRLVDTENTCWVRNYPIKHFDFSWHPDETEEPYIYVFGNNQFLAEECATVEYRISGATTVKYIPDIVATLDVNMDNWVIPDDVDTTDFDFSWIPNPSEPPYIYEFGTQWQKTGGPKYVMPGAWRGTKYVEDQTAKRLPNHQYWTVPDYIDKTSFDFSWHPDATEEPYNYVFATQWAFSGGPVYTVPGATETKYVEEQIATALPNKTNWEYDSDVIDVDSFDFSWHPYVEDQCYIYQFGTQWWETGGPRYITPGADKNSPIKYIDTRIIKSTTKPNLDNWEVPESVDETKFDFSWVPHPEDPPYIYVFGNQWYSAEKMPTVKYIVPDATELKYVSTISATLKPNKTNWIVSEKVVIKDFDFSWIPDPYDPPYNYVFGNQWYSAEDLSTVPQWYSAEDMPTVTYSVEGAKETKFISDIKAILGKNLTNWDIAEGVNVKKFDFSWIPHPAAPPYVYQFGTKLDNNDGPRYYSPNNTGEIVYLPRIELEHSDEPDEIVVGQYYIETSLSELVKQHPNEVFWALNKNIDYCAFDFSWRPGTVEVAWELEYVHVFGSSESESTHTYFVSAKHFLEGKTSFKYVDDIKLTDNVLLDMFVKPDMFFVDRGNHESAARFEALKAKYGTRIQKTRYLNSWVDTINRCTNRATSELLWVLNSELDYSDFNFDYYPNPWQMKMVHVFGTQWSHWGTTFMVNRETFSEDTKYIKIIEHLSNLNFVKEIRAQSTIASHDIIIVDHGNKETSSVASTLQRKAPDRTVNVVKYADSYLNTLKEVVKRLPEKKEHFIWICSSVCDYTNFDFTYIIDPFSRDNLHVFPSGKQKFGDTFFIDVNNARKVINELDKLENFTKVNYNGTVKAERIPEPVIVISEDTHTNSIDKITDFPYATLITSDNIDIGKADIEPMNLWSAETKNIYVTSTGATRIVVPKEIKDHVTKELYEYPYIKRAPKLALSKPLDIVFLSNGETGAEEHYEHLLNITKNLPNRVVRVDGVNGRAAAYHAAAEASETPWMFTVFAKLKVSPKFDFNWQPDRMQSPKHYIFHAKNPVNGLTYGHQAMIAYNKKLTLANDGKGLDFTLDDEHEVVPLISGTAQYNTDEFSTWRTAFREVIKLRADDSDVSKERLDAWLNKAEGDFAQYSIKGALDADEYYDEVDGDFDQLKFSYEWAWLREKFDQI